MLYTVISPLLKGMGMLGHNLGNACSLTSYLSFYSVINPANLFHPAKIYMD